MLKSHHIPTVFNLPHVHEQLKLRARVSPSQPTPLTQESLLLCRLRCSTIIPAVSSPPLITLPFIFRMATGQTLALCLCVGGLECRPFTSVCPFTVSVYLKSGGKTGPSITSHKAYSETHDGDLLIVEMSYNVVHLFRAIRCLTINIVFRAVQNLAKFLVQFV